MRLLTAVIERVDGRAPNRVGQEKIEALALALREAWSAGKRFSANLRRRAAALPRQGLDPRLSGARAAKTCSSMKSALHRAHFERPPPTGGDGDRGKSPGGFVDAGVDRVVSARTRRARRGAYAPAALSARGYRMAPPRLLPLLPAMGAIGGKPRLSGAHLCGSRGNAA